MEHQGNFVSNCIPKYYIKVFSHYFCIYLFSQLSPKESFKNAWENCRFEHYLCILTEYLRVPDLIFEISRKIIPIRHEKTPSRGINCMYFTFTTHVIKHLLCPISQNIAVRNSFVMIVSRFELTSDFPHNSDRGCHRIPLDDTRN